MTKEPFHPASETMAFQKQLVWKGITAPQFLRGSTCYSAHPVYLASMTWAPIPVKREHQPPIEILTLSPAILTHALDSSLIGTIDANEMTMHQCGTLDPTDNYVGHLKTSYICFIIRAPRGDDGQFQETIRNLRLVQAAHPGNRATNFPFPLITDDGKGIRLYYRVWSLATVCVIYIRASRY